MTDRQGASSRSIEPRRDAGAFLAWAAIAAAIVAQLLGAPYTVAMGLAFFVMGLAHGAGDEEGGRISAIGPVAAVAYLIVGAAVAALFIALPLAGLTLFLALSAWHFARSDRAMHPEARFAVAALAIGGSMLFQQKQTRGIFAEMLGNTPPDGFVLVLAGIGALGAIAACVALLRNRRSCGEAVIALAATALMQPVLAVGLVFLVAHALPVQRRQMAQYGTARVLRAVALPTAIAGAGFAILVTAVVQGWLQLPLASAIALGLATPHMLTERLER